MDIGLGSNLGHYYYFDFDLYGNGRNCILMAQGCPLPRFRPTYPPEYINYAKFMNVYKSTERSDFHK